MVSDEPGYEVSSPESEPCAHTRAHESARGRQVVGEEWRVMARAELFSCGVSFDV